MEIILKDNNTYVLRVEKGNDALEELQKFCSENQITAGFFRAIGSAKAITISWYNLEKKEYTDKHMQEIFEIISLGGNVAMLDGQAYIHAHGSFSNEAMETFAGHVKKLEVGATCEIVLEKLEGTIERIHSEEIGLNLLKPLLK